MPKRESVFDQDSLGAMRSRAPGIRLDDIVVDGIRRELTFLMMLALEPVSSLMSSKRSGFFKRKISFSIIDTVTDASLNFLCLTVEEPHNNKSKLQIQIEMLTSVLKGAFARIKQNVRTISTPVIHGDLIQKALTLFPSITVHRLDLTFPFNFSDEDEIQDFELLHLCASNLKRLSINANYVSPSSFVDRLQAALCQCSQLRQLALIGFNLPTSMFSCLKSMSSLTDFHYYSQWKNRFRKTFTYDHLPAVFSGTFEHSSLKRLSLDRCYLPLLPMLNVSVLSKLKTLRVMLDSLQESGQDVWQETLLTISIHLANKAQIILQSLDNRSNFSSTTIASWLSLSNDIRRPILYRFIRRNNGYDGLRAILLDIAGELQAKVAFSGLTIQEDAYDFHIVFRWMNSIVMIIPYDEHSSQVDD